MAQRVLVEADALMKSGDLREAFVACQAVLIDHSAHLPENLLAQLYLFMGQISIAQDKPERARKYLDRAAALQPTLTGLSDLRSNLVPEQVLPAAPLDQASESAVEPRDAPLVAQVPEESPLPSEVSDQQALAPPAEPLAHPATGPREGLSVQGRLAWVASFWSRTLAFGLDALLVLGLLIGMLALGAVALDLSSQDLMEAVAGGFMNLVLLAMLLFGLMLIYLGVFARFGGQTLGKMLLGLRVVRRDGHSLNTWGTVLRGLGMILAVLPGLAGFVWAAFDLNRCGWHDRVAGTMVVRMRPPRAALESGAPAPDGAMPATSKGV